MYFRGTVTFKLVIGAAQSCFEGDDDSHWQAKTMHDECISEEQ